MEVLPRRGDLPVVAAFDFDVTMTTRDTFFPFLNRAFGRARVIRACLRLVPEACKFVVGLSDRDRLKELLVRELFSGECVARLREEGRRYAAEILKWIRPAARAKVAWHKTRGHRLVMVSASLDLYLEPVCRDLGFDDLLCTRPADASIAVTIFSLPGRARAV
ncbi:MAG TPA: HAD-IB family phosphatase, partial [Nitrospira sp.]|nr:HAD-IB family phosphatase [Nitrospira sp.]